MEKDQLSNPYMQSALEEIVKEEGLFNPKIKIVPGSSKGDNYLGIVYRVQIVGQKSSDQNVEQKEQKLSLIFKCMPEAKERREKMRCAVYFNNEAYFYNKVLPTFKAFQQDKGIENDMFSCTAKCYRAFTNNCKDTNIEGAEEALFLQDMREEGYRMKDRLVGLDFNHCKLVMEQLAKLHALSIAMKHQRPQDFNNLKRNITETLFTDPPIEGIMDNINNQRDKIEEVLDAKEPGKPTYKQHINQFLDKYYENMLECVNGTSAEPYAVICHGDCWVNNMLFKYDQNETDPVNVILLDFQLSRYASPVLDLSYFFFCCTTQATRNKYSIPLLTRYYDTFSHFIYKLGSDPQKLFPLEVFKEHLVKYSKFGLGMAVMALPVFTSEHENIPDLDELCRQDDSTSPKIEINTNTLYQDRMAGVIVDMVNSGYI